jgi:hypothetical protein
VRDVDAQLTPVQVSAALLTEGDQECIGFTLSLLPPPAAAPGLPSQGLVAAAAHTASTPAMGSASSTDPRPLLGAAVERLAARLGELSLPDMLREVATLVERHALQSAARIGADDAAVARSLGISSASLNRRRRKLAGPRAARGPGSTAGRKP